MSAILRAILLLAAVAFAGYILLKIRKCKVKMEDAIFWVCLAVVLLIMGIFPKVTYWLTGLFHMQSPANLIFLIIIFLLLEKVLTLSIITSQLEDKVTVLSAEVALRSRDERVRNEVQAENLQKLSAEDAIAAVQSVNREDVVDSGYDADNETVNIDHASGFAGDDRRPGKAE